MTEKLKSLWNSYNDRLLVYLIEGVDFPLKYGAEVKITSMQTKSSFKAKPKLNKTESPEWHEMFCFDHCPESVVFEVGYSTNQRDKLKALLPEVIHEEWIDLQAKKDKYVEKAGGRMRVRFFRTSQPDLRSLRLAPERVIYWYNKYRSDMKTGDIILYSGRGPVHESTKLITGTHYSHIGMVLELPNRYTHEKELFVIEITSNRNGMPDAFRERISDGICIFRLFERLHHYHGSGAWWIPLDEEAYNQMDLKNLVQFVSKLHSETNVDGSPPDCIIRPTYRQNQSEFIRQFKLENQASELFGPQLIFALLNAAEIIAGDSFTQEAISNLMIPEILNMGCFKSPLALWAIEPLVSNFAPELSGASNEFKSSIHGALIKLQARRDSIAGNSHNYNNNSTSNNNINYNIGNNNNNISNNNNNSPSNVNGDNASNKPLTLVINDLVKQQLDDTLNDNDQDILLDLYREFGLSSDNSSDFPVSASPHKSPQSARPVSVAPKITPMPSSASSPSIPTIYGVHSSANALPNASPNGVKIVPRASVSSAPNFSPYNSDSVTTSPIAPRNAVFQQEIPRTPPVLVPPQQNLLEMIYVEGIIPVGIPLPDSAIVRLDNRKSKKKSKTSSNSIKDNNNINTSNISSLNQHNFSSSSSSNSSQKTYSKRGRPSCRRGTLSKTKTTKKNEDDLAVSQGISPDDVSMLLSQQQLQQQPVPKRYFVTNPRTTEHLFRTPEKEIVVLAALNWWSAEILSEILSPIIGDTVVEMLVQMKQMNGGIFWSEEDLQKILTKILPGNSPRAAQSSSPSSSPSIPNPPSPTQIQQFFDGVFSAVLSSGIDLSALVHVIAPQVCSGCAVSTVMDGPACSDRLLSTINGAQYYIHVSVCLFANDIYGKEIAEALISKVKEKVEVRIIVDNISTLESTKRSDSDYSASTGNSGLKKGDFFQLLRKMEKVGVKVVVSSKLCYCDSSWEVTRKEMHKKGVPEEFLKIQDLVQQSFTGENILNHRKFIIVDGVVSMIGSSNLTGECFYDIPLKPEVGNPCGIPPSKEFHHDGMIFIEGQSFACALNVLFASMWMVLGGDVFDISSEFYYGINK